jgi:protein-disulfide isomerase
MITSFNKIKESTVLQGDKDARFTILEYSELLCPYCKRQSDQGTISAVIKEHPEEVNAAFRNFIVHAPAAKLAEGIECVSELDAKKHHEFIEAAFAHNGSLNTDELVRIANDLGIDNDDMKECLDSNKYTETVANQTTEGRNLFGVTGTPGNVIIDGETGKFVLIPGAYPAEKFIEEIEKMKNSN